MIAAPPVARARGRPSEPRALGWQPTAAGRPPAAEAAREPSESACPQRSSELGDGKVGIFFVFAKGLRAQRAGRVAPRRGGAKRRAAALGAAQRPKAPPQAAERRAAHKACFSAFNFAPIIEKQKMLTGRSAGIRPVLWPGQPLGIKLHGQRLRTYAVTKTCL